jgi:DNA-binding HxlR family transcriptional regulator
MSNDKLIIPYWLEGQSTARMPLASKQHHRKTLREQETLMRRLRNDKICPATETIRKVGNELRIFVLTCLITGPLRFSELLQLAKGVDPRSISRVLKYLESEEIVQRDVLSTRPLAVRYSLTEKGRQLEPVIDALRVWGQRWIVPLGVIPATEKFTRRDSRT